jgi:hypothetical protein
MRCQHKPRRGKDFKGSDQGRRNTLVPTVAVEVVHPEPKKLGVLDGSAPYLRHFRSCFPRLDEPLHRSRSADCGSPICQGCLVECCGETFCEYCADYHQTHDCVRKPIQAERRAHGRDSAA